jgi:RNA polymerase sigma-70 factor (ECF subfamily)
MACQTPNRFDPGDRHPRATSTERRTEGLVKARPQSEKCPTAASRRGQPAGFGGVGVDEEATAPRLSPSPRRAGQKSRDWLARLQAVGPERDAALAELHALLLRAARFEIGRRAGARNLRGGDHEDLAQQSADDALVVILRKLGEFRGESRFTTWAYKFAIFEAAAKLRKRSWQAREIPLAPEAWPLITDEHQLTAQQAVETADRLCAVREAIEEDLSPHQREVLVALALNEVPVDVLAERLSTTRGALYKTVHDARRKLRGALTARGMGLGEQMERSLASVGVAQAPEPEKQMYVPREAPAAA